jgi:hypothetical protein
MTYAQVYVIFIMMLQYSHMEFQEELNKHLRKAREMKSYYRGLGLLTATFGLDDEPGEAEPMHKHGAARIFIIAGSIELQLEGEEPRTVQAGEEIIIKDQQAHGVTIGSDGWHYLFACDAAEADAQEITHLVS